MKLKILLSVIIILMTHLAISQTVSPELVSSAGDSFNNTSYQLDWSIGECVTATHSAGAYVITQGFHQNTYIITSVEDLRADIEMLVYPNPTSDFINLKVESSKVESLQFTITDLSGKVLQNGKFANQTEQIYFSSYAVGTYLITISQNNQILKSFQIIKN